MRRLIIQILVGSIREGRKSLPVAQWVGERAALREEFQAELDDLADWSLPMLSFAKPPAMGLSDDATQRRWAAKIGAADGYIFVSPEYNHGSSAVLKNALDYLYAEWNRKPAAFVSFGNTGGARAVEHLRGVAIELRMAALGEAVHILDVGDKVTDGRFAGDGRDEKQLTLLFDSLAWWGRALSTAREWTVKANNPSNRRSARGNPMQPRLSGAAPRSQASKYPDCEESHPAHPQHGGVTLPTGHRVELVAEFQARPTVSPTTPGTKGRRA